MATIHMIAEALGVSTATVSRALNHSQLVNPDVRQRVQAKASELGYKPRKIRRQRERLIVTVKLVLPKTNDPTQSLFHATSDLINGLKEGLKPSPANIICDIGVSSEGLFSNKKVGSVDCVVFAFNEPNAETVRLVKAQQVPSLVLNRSVPGLTSISEDAVSGMRQVISRVMDVDPSRKIILIADRLAGGIYQSRREAFINACRAEAVPGDLEANVWDIDSVNDIHISSLKKRMSGGTVFLCMTDVLASVVLTELQSNGLKVPEDAWICGFGGSPLLHATRPRLTSVRMPVARIAREAGSQLLKRVLDHEFMPMNVYIGGELMIGDTLPVF